MRRVQLQGGARGPHARRTLCTLSVRLSAPTPQTFGGGLRPPSDPSPQVSLRRQSRRSEVEHFSPWQAGNRSEIAPPSDRCSNSSAGFARATDSWGRLRRGPPRPPPIERRRWALIIALGAVRKGGSPVWARRPPSTTSSAPV